MVFYLCFSVLSGFFIIIWLFHHKKTDDFYVFFDIKDIEEAKKYRKRAMKTWKNEDIEVRDITEEWNERWLKKKKYKEVFM